MNGKICRNSSINRVPLIICDSNANLMFLSNHGQLKKLMYQYVPLLQLILHALPSLIAQQGSQCDPSMWKRLIKVRGITTS